MTRPQRRWHQRVDPARVRRVMHWKKAFGFSAVVLSGCGPTAWQQSAAPTAAYGNEADPAVLAAVDGRAITRQDVPASTRQQLQDLDNETAQRRYQLLWTGVEQAIAQRLLGAEAQRQGTDIANLLQTEVDSKVGTASDAEIHGLYEANRALINVSYEVAAPVLKEQWHTDRVVQLRRALIDRLRQSSSVAYTLPPPNLPRYPVEAAQAPVLGPAQAKITIVEFGDFQCPYSAQARRLLNTVAQQYKDQVRVVFRGFPLSQHPRAQQAAEAAQCAAEQGKFWAYHDLLFDNSEALEPADLKRYASVAELNLDQFNACLASERPAQAVLADRSAGQRFGVAGTPALFVNGMRLQGVLPLPLMQAIIDRELATL